MRQLLHRCALFLAAGMAALLQSCAHHDGNRQGVRHAQTPPTIQGGQPDIGRPELRATSESRSASRSSDAHSPTGTDAVGIATYDSVLGRFLQSGSGRSALIGALAGTLARPGEERLQTGLSEPEPERLQPSQKPARILHKAKTQGRNQPSILKTRKTVNAASVDDRDHAGGRIAGFSTVGDLLADGLGMADGQRSDASPGPLRQVSASESQGNSAISAPTSAEEGVPFRALLRVSRTEMKALMAGLDAEVPGNRTEPMQAALSMSPVMTASVSGVDFEFSPAEPQTQAIDLDGDTTWEWDVKAKRSGTLTLVFRLSTNVVKDGQTAIRAVKHYRKNVDVKVSTGSVVQQHSGTIASVAATIVAALLTVWLTVWLQRRYAAEDKRALDSTTDSHSATTTAPTARPNKGKPAPPSKRRPGTRGR